VVLALHHDDMEPAFEEGLTLANTVLIGFFTAELALKVLGLGVVGYVSDKVNVFDAIVVLISLVEVGLAGDTGCAAAGPPLAARQHAAAWATELFTETELVRSAVGGHLRPRRPDCMTRSSSCARARG
jgi:hypothetical protein